MRKFNLSGVIDVDMYQGFLNPDYAFERDDPSEEQWDNFSIDKYVELVLELAIKELKKMLATLPERLRCEYVEGGGQIWSPKYYNYQTDTLEFSVVSDYVGSEQEYQKEIDAFFKTDWDAEFSAAYRIFDIITSDYLIDSFQISEEEQR